ncbi:hypothetical protein BCR34DRAFT_557768 [Clohesyomyces aquaticus]|uniref:Uncharacterized protein n=1 Tax=Clohesyomyces aquaticus TaxID=1231657 RepID=A0A1Y2A1E6_9PLEO|nr:hypothetical protein BCR34DRAFT_557768 [Clohesyomyces aquaticus]
MDSNANLIMDEKTEYRGLEQDPLPTYSSWPPEAAQDEGRGKTRWTKFRGTVAWTQAYDSTKQAIEKTPSFARDKVWPIVRKAKPTKKQIYAFLILLFFGIGPMLVAVVLGMLMSAGGGLFAAKTISCGNSLGKLQNSTVVGIEGLFVLDLVAGKFPFSQVKIIDVGWDLCVGRGAQLLAWWSSYIVFSDALLRVIERHPTSFQTFTHIALEGASLGSMWALLKNLFKSRSKQTWILFFYMLISIFWILTMPTVLSAMTGYVNTSIAWVSIGNGSQIVPASEFVNGAYITKAGNQTFDKVCLENDPFTGIYYQLSTRDDYCNCSLSNGTITSYYNRSHIYDSSPDIYYNLYPYISYPYIDSPYWSGYGYGRYRQNKTICSFDYPNNTETFTWTDKSGQTRESKCNVKWNVTIAGHDYDYNSVNYSDYAYCNNGKGYDLFELEDTSRCLPDTAFPGYQWGFSSMLSTLFAIVHSVWAVSMYIIWQDAQFNSELVKSGFALTQLRAAFALATAAKDKTGMKSKELVRADTKSLENQLFGTKKKKEAEVDYGIFQNELKGERSRNESSLLRRPGWPSVGRSDDV